MLSPFVLSWSIAQATAATLLVTCIGAAAVWLVIIVIVLIQARRVKGLSGVLVALTMVPVIGFFGAVVAISAAPIYGADVNVATMWLGNVMMFASIILLIAASVAWLRADKSHPRTGPNHE